MKALIFLIFIVLIISAMVWNMRKSQAKTDLARLESIERRREQEKEAVTPMEDMEWPVIIRPVSGRDPSGAEKAIEEPSMTTIEFVPDEHPLPQQRSSTKAGTYQ